MSMFCCVAVLCCVRSEAVRDFGAFLMDTNIPVEYSLVFPVSQTGCIVGYLCSVMVSSLLFTARWILLLFDTNIPVEYSLVFPVSKHQVYFWSALAL
jgi:hypothetical protein